VRSKSHAWLVLGLCALSLAAPPARAEEKNPTPPADPAAGAPATPPGGAPAAPLGDPKDKQRIDELERLLRDALERLERVERNQMPAPTPMPAPPPTPEPEPRSGRGGATFLPNISAIGNLVIGGGDTRGLDNPGIFNTQEFELAIQDAVAPKLRYDIYLAAAKEEGWSVGFEEGFVTASAVFPGLNARIGRIRTPIGKFNPLHPHSWRFITQPSVVTAFLGPEGLNADGAVLEYLFPVGGFLLRGELGVWQTASESEDGLGSGIGDGPAYSARLFAGLQAGRDAEVEIGVTRYQGRGEVEGLGKQAHRKIIHAADLTYRKFMGRGRRLIAAAELFQHETSLPGGDADRIGGFAYLAYRLNKFWEVGARGDYTEFPAGLAGRDRAASLFITKYLTEQTSLRLEYQYGNSTLEGSGHGVYFQIIFGSGPHQHQLQ
jgi:hypothetical protein